jgi:hypothetical protein
VSEEEKKEIYQNYDEKWDTVFNSLLLWDSLRARSQPSMHPKLSARKSTNASETGEVDLVSSSRRSMTWEPTSMPMRQLQLLSGGRSLK